ncbi:MAG: hypothetical protein E7525_05215 [Ruminococcaceae bacterium]|nr:hypothetical protein [Oscillospiraceae bacterium]
MRDLFFKLFESSHFDTGITVTAFSVSHIIYMVLIFGSIIGGHLLLRNKALEAKTKAMRILAYVLMLSYFSDFFVHEFVYDGLNTDKLPFHVCTFLGVLVAFSQFNRNGHKVREPIAILSILTPMMYLCFPATTGGGEPWCYQAVQTMFFHSVLMAWGILSVSLKIVEPHIKKSWQCAVLLGIVTLWAKLGNLLYEHNWFFLEEDAFYIGVVEQGIIPKWTLMVINPVVCFLAVLGCYGVIHIVTAITRKKELVNT